MIDTNKTGLEPVKRRIRWKILLPFALLSIVMALAGTYITTRVVAGSLGERFDNQLAEAARVSADAMVLRERKHLELLRAVTFTEGTAAAISNRDSARLEQLVLPLVFNAQLDRVEVVDSAGELLYGVRRAAPDAAQYAALEAQEPYGDWPAVRNVLSGVKDPSGDKFAGITPAAQGHLFYTAGPVLVDGQIAGAVVVSSDLQALLGTVKLQALSDLTFYDAGGTPIASTLSAEGEDRPDSMLPGPLALEGLRGDGIIREAKSIRSRDYDFLYGKLFLRGEPYLYSVALPSSFISSASNLTRWQMTVLFTIATAAVLVTGSLVAGALTRPIMRLARTAEAVAAGDLAARSGVASGDEIGFLAQTFDTMTAKLQRQHISTVKALASAIDARDPYTLGHSLRVGQLASRLGQRLELSSVEIQHLEIGGYLHDVGKIGIRDSILLKPDVLTGDERHLIEEHPLIGLRIIDPIELPDAVRQFVAAHHEKIDGSGYPNHLQANELSIFARIGAVADMYDALITDRPYRPAFSLDAVLELLTREADEGRLDGRVVDALVSIAAAWEIERRDDESLIRFADLYPQPEPSAA